MKNTRKAREQAMKNKKIIAVDFDGTLCENKYPEIGAPILSTIEQLKDAQREGAALILWTCRCGKELTAAVAWCMAQGLTFDAVNANLAEHIEQFGGDTRKVFATEYWDDRACFPIELADALQASGAKNLAADLLEWLNKNRESLETTIRWGRESGATLKGIEAYIRAAQLDDVAEYLQILLKKYDVSASV